MIASVSRWNPRPGVFYAVVVYARSYLGSFCHFGGMFYMLGSMPTISNLSCQSSVFMREGHVLLWPRIRFLSVEWERCE